MTKTFQKNEKNMTSCANAWPKQTFWYHQKTLSKKNGFLSALFLSYDGVV